MNLEDFLPMVGERSTNETDATFSDVYDVCASKFCHFTHLGMHMEVIDLFEAKTDTFRDQISQIVKSDIILLRLAFVFASEMGIVLASSTPEPCANQCFRLHFAIPDFSKVNKVFTFHF